MIHADVDAEARRLMQRAHTRDGLPEIAMGLSFLAASGLIYAQVVLPRQSVGFKAAVLAFSLGLPLTIFTPTVLRWARRRYLMARVGYVEPYPVGRKAIVRGVLGALVFAGVLFGVVPRMAQPDRWLLAGTGLLGGALLAWCGRLPRFVIGGVLMAAVGLLVAFSGVDLQAGFAILFGSLGVLGLVSGGIVLARFLRQPIRTDE